MAAAIPPRLSCPWSQVCCCGDWWVGLTPELTTEATHLLYVAHLTKPHPFVPVERFHLRHAAEIPAVCGRR